LIGLIVVHVLYDQSVTQTFTPVLSALNSDYESWASSGTASRRPNWNNFLLALADFFEVDQSQFLIKFVQDDNIGVRLGEASKTETIYHVMVCGKGNNFDSTSFNTEPRIHVENGNSEVVLLFRLNDDGVVGTFEPWRCIGLEHSPVRQKIVPLASFEDLYVMNSSSIRFAIMRIASLQANYVADPKNEAMVTRKQILSELALYVGSRINSNPTFLAQMVDAHYGQGNNVRTPYIRIYDPAKSPNAQTGFYVCLFISADGTLVLPSIQSGANKWEDGRLKALPKANLTQRSDKIYQDLIKDTAFGLFLGAENASRDLPLEGATGEIGSKIEIFKYSNIASSEIQIDQLPSDTELLATLRGLTEIATFLNQSDSSVAKTVVDGANMISQNIYWSLDRVNDVLESLKDKSPQAVLAGPPGTGKTFVARWFAAELLGQSGNLSSDQITFVQFHPTYGYEDFVEGLRPVSRNGVVVFETVPGIIVKISQAILQDGLPRVLIIDEINRANIARVFGELMYLLEYRDQKIDLMLHQGFELPSNLYIIATMNTADKSTRVMDTALRRRFDFFTLNPDVEILRAHYSIGGASNEIGDELFNGFIDLNEALTKDLDKHRLIGHSYFMEEVFDFAVLRSRWERQIAPLLDEYFFERNASENKYSLERFWPSVKS
jgi:hypothetical protein